MTSVQTDGKCVISEDILCLVEQLTDLIRDGKHAEFDELLAANPCNFDADRSCSVVTQSNPPPLAA